MKIQLRTILIKCLIIGTMLSSCTDTQPENDRIYFNYYNKTGEDLELKLFDENNFNFKNYDFPSEVKSPLQIDLKQDKGKGVGIPFLFNDGQHAKKIVIVFKKSNKCLVNYYKILESKYYDNYNENMLNTYGNYLDYTIDKEELDLATTCL